MTAKTRWDSLLSSLDLSDTDGAVYRELHRLYAESHRKYHNLQHVIDCLQHLDGNHPPGTNPAAIELAIWFHDAIYSPLRGNNEQASAALARQLLSHLGADLPLIDTVHELIMVTTHRCEPCNIDQALMEDIDLAILGSDRDDFEAYESAIRCEYKLVPGPLYRRQRKALLQSFLARPAIFNTQPFVESREAAARENLEWAISQL